MCLNMKQSVLNDPKAADPKAEKGDRLVASQNEKKSRFLLLKRAEKGKLQNEEEGDPVNKGGPHCQLVQ